MFSQSTPRKSRLIEASEIARNFIRYLLNGHIRDTVVIDRLMIDLKYRRGHKGNRKAYRRAAFDIQVLPELIAANDGAHPVASIVRLLLLMFDERPLFMTDKQLKRVAKYFVDAFRVG